MQIVQASEPQKLCRAVYAVSLNTDDGLAIAHEGGILSIWQKHELVGCVGFPGRKIIKIATDSGPSTSNINGIVYIAFSDGSLTSVLVEGGVSISTAHLDSDDAIRGISIASNAVCVWGETKRVSFFARYSLSLLKQLSFESIPVAVRPHSVPGQTAVFLANGGFVILNELFEKIQRFELPIVHPIPLSSLVLDAIEICQGQWLFCQRHSWTICEPVDFNEDGPLSTDLSPSIQIEVSATMATDIRRIASNDSDIVTIQCSDDTILCLKGSSMHVLQPNWGPNSQLVAVIQKGSEFKALTADLKLHINAPSSTGASWLEGFELCPIDSSSNFLVELSDRTGPRLCASGNMLYSFNTEGLKQLKVFSTKIMSFTRAKDKICVGLESGSMHILNSNFEEESILTVASGPIVTLRLEGVWILARSNDAIALIKADDISDRLMIPIGTSISQVSINGNIVTVQTTYDSSLLCWDLEYRARVCQVEPKRLFVRDKCNSVGLPFAYSVVTDPAVKNQLWTGIQSMSHEDGGAISAMSPKVLCPEAWSLSAHTGKRPDALAAALRFMTYPFDDARDYASLVASNWTEQHRLDLMLSSDHSDLRILAAMAKHGDVLIYKKLSRHVKQLLKSRRPSSISLAFELLGVAPAIADIPFDEIQLGCSKDMISRYSRRLCQVDKLWFVQKLYDEASRMHTHAEVACKLIGAAIDSKDLVPLTESWLRAVEILVIGARLHGQAKIIACEYIKKISELYPDSCIHEPEREQLAAISPENDDLGVLFELSVSTDYVLSMPPEPLKSSIVFANEGRKLEAECESGKLYWKIPGSFLSLFRSNNRIIPQIVPQIVKP